MRLGLWAKDTLNVTVLPETKVTQQRTLNVTSSLQCQKDDP